MQLQDVATVATRTAALLDNQSMSRFTQAYLMPYIDQEYSEMDMELEALGAPYSLEQTVLTAIPPGTTSLATYMAPGQPLAYMKVPTEIWWKRSGQPDTGYGMSTGPLNQLPFVASNNVGTWNWTFLGGMLAVTPSNQTVDLQVTYQTLSTNIVDPQTGVILGTAGWLALRVAFYVANLRGMPIGALLEKKLTATARNFKLTLLKPRQGVPLITPKAHGRVVRTSPTGYI